MITEQDVKLAYRKDTGHEWIDVKVEEAPLRIEKRKFDEQFAWIMEKLLEHENNLLKVANLFQQ